MASRILSPTIVPHWFAAPWPWGRSALLLARAALSSLTILLAATGQWFLSRPAGVAVGATLYGTAVVCLLATLVLQRKAASTSFAGARAWPRRGLLIPSAVFAQFAAAALVYTDSPFVLLATGLWLVSILLAVGAAAQACWPGQTLSSGIARMRSALAVPRIDMAVLGVILVTGAALRLVSLDGYPSGIHGDEAEFGLVALSVLKGNGPHPFGTAFLGDPALFTWIEAPFVLVFGPTITAVRLLSALVGTATLISSYALTRSMLGPRVATLATAFLAGAAVAIHFSRLALNIPEVLLLASLSFYCLWRAYCSETPVWWLLSGLTAGGAFYFHFTGRLVPVVIALFMFYALALRRMALRTWVRDIGLLCAGWVMALVPLAAFLATRSDQLVEHVDSRLIFGEWNRVARQNGTSDPLGVLWGQFTINLSAFTNRQDASQFYTFTGAPMLNGVTAALFVLGLALTVVRLRNPRYALIFFWFWTFVIIGGALTVDSPQFHRLLPALLPALIAAAVALEWIAGVWTGLLGRSAAGLLSAMALLVPVASAAYDASAYVYADAHASPWPDTTLQARYIAALGPGYQVLVAGVPYIYASHGITRYLAGGVGASDLSDPPVQLPQAPLTRPVAILVNPALESWLPSLETVYPDGQATPVALPNGRVGFTSFVVPAGGSPGGWPSGHGLAGQVRASDPSTPVWVRTSPVVAFRDVGALVSGGRAPFLGQWRGSLSVPRSGAYALELWTDGAATLQVDGETVMRAPQPADQPRSVTQTVVLTVGSHQVQIDDQFPRSPGMLELYWQEPGAARALVPAANLLPPG